MPRSNLVFAAAAGALVYWAGKRLARISRYLNPRGKNVLITGGSRGLGLVLARQFAQRGANIAVLARSEEELNRVTDEFIHRNVKFVAITCDVTHREDAEKAVAQAEATIGPIDILINNAGTICVGPFETMTAEDFQQALDTHFWAPLYMTWAVLPSMRERRGGEGGGRGGVAESSISPPSAARSPFHTSPPTAPASSPSPDSPSACGQNWPRTTSS